jgi:hypothetical protein
MFNKVLLVIPSSLNVFSLSVKHLIYGYGGVTSSYYASEAVPSNPTCSKESVSMKS